MTGDKSLKQALPPSTFGSSRHISRSRVWSCFAPGASTLRFRSKHQQRWVRTRTPRLSQLGTSGLSRVRLVQVTELATSLSTQTLHGTAIYAYIGVVLGVNVGIYGIHGVSGVWNEAHFRCPTPVSASFDPRAERGLSASLGRPGPGPEAREVLVAQQGVQARLARVGVTDGCWVEVEVLEVVVPVVSYTRKTGFGRSKHVGSRAYTRQVWLVVSIQKKYESVQWVLRSSQVKVKKINI